MKFNCTIDGNYLLNRLVFPLSQSNSLYGELANSLQSSVERQMSLLPFNQVFFVSDGKRSWRKDAVATYKANREVNKKQDVDWSFVFECYAEFKSKLDPNRFTHLENESLEGDDWIGQIVRESNKKGISTLTITADQDMLQNLRYSIDPHFINIQLRDTLMNEKVWFPQGYSVFMNNIQRAKIDLFELDWRFDFLELMKKFSKYSVEEVNPKQSLFEKVVHGDSSDEITSILTTYTKTTPPKPRGIGDSGATKIWHNFLEHSDEHYSFEDPDTIDLIADLAMEYKKVDKATFKQTVLAKIYENIKLIQLDPKHMPVEQYNKLTEMVVIK